MNTPVPEKLCNSNAPGEPEILTKAQTAGFLQCSSRKIDYLRHRGLPWIQLGGEVRFFRADILSYLTARRVGR